MKSVPLPPDRWWPPRGAPADRVLAAVVGVATVAEVGSVGYGAATPWVMALGVVVAGCLAWRRTHPLPAVAVAMAAFALLAVVDVATNDLTSVVGALLVLVHSVAMWGPRAHAVAGLALAVASVSAVIWGEGGKPFGEYLYAWLLIVAAWGLGRALQGRILQVTALAEQAARAEAAHEHAAVLAVADERARIARELHDIVSHGLSVVVVQAAAAEALVADAPEEAAAAMRAIQEVGQHAQADMVRMLGLLRATGGEATLVPMPGLDDLAELVDRVRAAGLPVELHVAGAPRAVPAAVALTAYRVVQEALTNVQRHAGSAPTRVGVEHAPDRLRVTVANAVPTSTRRAAAGAVQPGAGVGLVGMRERVDSCGGTLTVGPAPSGEFVVTADLPLGEA